MDNQNNLEGKNILIAEDEIINYIYISEILETSNANLFHALNGKLAVDMVNKQSFDLVLMDLKMPEMTGYEASRIIRKNFPNLPIIALTAFAFQDEIKKALQAGCNDYLIKPFKKKEFFILINKILEAEN